jgi:hypothetical protein
MRHYSRMQGVTSQFGRPARDGARAWDQTGTAARERLLAATRRRTVRLSRPLGLLLAMVLWSVPCLAAVEEQPCWGDCDSTGRVTVDELLTCVNIALGTYPVDTCLNGDASGDDIVTVDEILTAVNNALNGCPGAGPTGTPTPTPTPTPNTTPGASDVDHDGIPDNLEIQGYSCDKGTGQFVAWDGNPDTEHWFSHYNRWSTDGDPYSDAMEAGWVDGFQYCGEAMDDAVETPGKQPYVAAFPDIVVQLLARIIHEGSELMDRGLR